MARCNQCGSELPDYYTSCPNCGCQSISKGAAAQGYGQQAGYSMPVQTREITSPGQWFGWLLLMGVLPIIGAVIVMKSSRDQTAQNYAKLVIILQAISMVCSFFMKSFMTPIIEEIVSRY
ncbi:MAG TPA: hypothetical protein DCG49_06010 [Ruminococcus sp.]|nr:hypothetical protein [Ruminococcus sp.]